MAERSFDPTEGNEGDRLVPLGRVWLHGHFCGVVTTSNHCMEVTIPLQHELPISALLPAVAALGEASGTEFEGNARERRERAGRAEGPADGTSRSSSPRAGASDPGAGETTAANSGRLSKKHWQELSTLLAAALPSGEAAGGPGAPAGFTPRGDASPGSPSLAKKEAALEIDYEAKEALVRELMGERDRLLAENQSLQEQMETGPLRRLIKQSSSIFDGGNGGHGSHGGHGGHGGSSPRRSSNRRSIRRVSSEKMELGSIHESGAESERVGRFREHAAAASGRRGSRSLTVGSALSGPGESKLHIEGHFTGHVRTPLHLLDIALPVRGQVPGHAVMEIAAALAGRSLDAPGAGRHSHRHRRNSRTTMPDIWSKLHRMLGLELPEPCEAAEAAAVAGPTSPEAAAAAAAAAVVAEAKDAAPGTGQGGSGMVLVNMAELERKLQELERLALQLTSAPAS